MKSNLQWTKEGNKHLLKNDGYTQIELTIQTGGKSICIINGIQYIISSKGFWQPVYQIQKEGVEILKLTHSFWGSNGTIQFENGSTYSLKYTTGSNFKLIFRDAENDIITYGTARANNQLAMTYHIGISMVDADKILLLSALGMVIFYSMCREFMSDDDTNSLNLLLFTA